jgi:hypothetical protein
MRSSRRRDCGRHWIGGMHALGNKDEEPAFLSRRKQREMGEHIIALDICAGCCLE